MSRAFWFAAGVASGVYGVFKVKRRLEIFTPDGIGARLAAVRRGAHVFAEEVSEAAQQREAELLAELRASSAEARLLPAAETPEVAAPRHAAKIPEYSRAIESVTDGHR